jgi:hypothetical protein
VLSAMLGIGAAGAPILSTWLIVSALIAMLPLLAVHGYMRERQLHVEVQRLPTVVVGALWASMAFLIAITQGGGDAFIYFQF